jgi:hypothetical protein
VLKILQQCVCGGGGGRVVRPHCMFMLIVTVIKKTDQHCIMRA